MCLPDDSGGCRCYRNAFGIERILLIMEEKHIFSILVDNEPGVLSRISGLFSGRGFNIESLCVAETTDPLISRITLVTSGEPPIIEQIEKQLNKLINVIKVHDLTEKESMRWFLKNERRVTPLMMAANNVTFIYMTFYTCSFQKLFGYYRCLHFWLKHEISFLVFFAGCCSALYISNLNFSFYH